MKRRKSWRMSYDVGEVTESSFSNPTVVLPTSQFILQPFRCFTYVTALSPTLLSLLLRHRLFTWRAAHDLVNVKIVFCPRAGLPLQTQEPRLLKGISSISNSGTQAAVLLGMNRWDSLPLLSAHHSLFRISTDLKISQEHYRGCEESGFG